MARTTRSIRPIRPTNRGASGAAPIVESYYYVDNAAAGANDGTSWADAWESFADVSWATLAANVPATLYISGGNISKTYNEIMTIGASGSWGTYITIDVGANSPAPAGHTGTVIIDGGGARRYGIVGSSRSYIAINGYDGGGNYRLLIQNTIVVVEGNACIYLENGSNCYVDYVQMDNAATRGVYFNTMTNSRILGCDIRTGNVSNAVQTDCIYVGYGSDNIVDNNVCILGNSGAGHHDCLQIGNGGKLIVRNNWLEWTDARGNVNCQTLLMSGCTDWAYAYNNIVIGCSVGNNLLIGSGSLNGKYYLWNNTVVQTTTSCNPLTIIGCDEAYMGEIKNNIIYIDANTECIGTSASGTFVGKLDYNCLYTTHAHVSYIGGVSRTWAAHQAAGYDPSGINADPVFVTEYTDLHLQVTSPCRDVGADLTAYFTTDRDGVARPNGAPWEIGAYEFV